MFSDWITWLPDLLSALVVSVSVAGLSLLIGLPFGLLLALGMVSHRTWLRRVSVVVVEVGRAIPLLVVLYLIYFGLPPTGLVLSSFAAAVAGIAFSTGVYTAEIFRAGILSVPSGHLEAATSLGLTWRDEARFIVLPQAIRSVVPPLVSFSIIIFQATSLGYAIALPELLSQAYSIGSVTFQFLSVFILAGLIYAAISIFVSRIVDYVHVRTGY